MDSSDGSDDNASIGVANKGGAKSTKAPTKISRNHLLTAKMTTSHAISIIGPGRKEEQVQAMLERLEEQKKHCNGYARMELKKRMVEAAIEVGLSYHKKLVRSFEEIRLAWAEDAGVINAEKLFSVLYGNFDLDPDWLTMMEKAYMGLVQWEYDDDRTSKHSIDESPSKHRIDNDGGCVQKLITRAKNELIKQVNKQAQKTHGQVIRITRLTHEIHDKNRFKKRIKGRFNQSFLYETKRGDHKSKTEEDDDQYEQLDIINLDEDSGGEDKITTPRKRTKQVATSYQKIKAEQKLKLLTQANRDEENRRDKRDRENRERELRREMSKMNVDLQQHVTDVRREYDQSIISSKRKPEHAKPKATNKKKKKEPEPEPEYELSEYEKIRAKNVERNAKRMEELRLEHVRNLMKSSTIKAKQNKKKGANQEPNIDNADTSNASAIDKTNVNLSESVEPDAIDPTGEAIVAIVGHSLRNELPFLNVKWDNDYISWEEFKPVLRDARKIVKEYIEIHQLGDPFDTGKRKKKGESCVEKNCPDQKCNNNHDAYYVGTNYKEEPNIAYWDEGQAMHGVDCAGCGAKFVRELQKGKYFKPTHKQPIMTCTNREKCACQHAICFLCFQSGLSKMLEQESSEVGGSKRKVRGAHN